MSQVNWPAVGFTILPNIGGIAGGILVRKNIDTWYASLKKPEWRPPNAAFGPIWTSLYTGMGYASYLVYRDGDGFNAAVSWYALKYMPLETSSVLNQRRGKNPETSIPSKEATGAYKLN